MGIMVNFNKEMELYFLSRLKETDLKTISYHQGLKCEGWDGPCDSIDAKTIRMNTNYMNESSNYRTLCPYCEEQCRKHWDEMWKEYYSERV